MSSSPKQNIKKSKLRLLHQYYSYTGFYTFVKSSLAKVIIPTLLFIGVLWAIHEYVIDFNELFTTITNTYNPLSILAVFFASESLLGLVPPEIFIAWADQTTSPILYLTLLAFLSYCGGIVSFFIGKSISRIPSVYRYFTLKMNKQVKMIRKWGGFLIVVGALLPIPFAITSIAAGLIHYNFRYYLAFALLRFLRFYLYAVVIFQLF
ncbi:MAG: short-chain dehydrogenase [Bacteroidia bacterium]|nr:short-chain dehydrogenase [Bacteroidia bacterium]NND24593.1 short-chain dehydrogenase [Flavobacteriaceae bacterium]NNK61269.1 short-chain dehydrogenase [Flavobacteriaceae bacterium]NNL31873.1 short-chain dehydrogenase [Flavobacteriaceae bacterium]RZW44853.1 MAG: short-chain dehydrogenase [Flavobacteriaceae bacterium]